MYTTTEFYLPKINSFEHILKEAQTKVANAEKPRTALVVHRESRMLSSFGKAIEMGLIDPIIIGDEKLFRESTSGNKIDPDKIKFIDINEPDKAVELSIKMAVAGELDLILKGRISAEEFLKRIFVKNSGFMKKGKNISHVSVLKPAKYRKLVMITDGAVNVKNDLKSLMDVINTAISFSHKLTIEKPRVALLAAVEVVYPQMDVTIKGATLSKMAERGQIKGAFIDGPLSFDVAVDMEAAHSKGIKDSPVAGQADILVAPDIDTASGLYKAMSLFGDVEMGGVVYGGCVPVTLSAYCDSEQTRFNSILLAVLACN